MRRSASRTRERARSLALASLLLGAASLAGEADIVNVDVRPEAEGSYRFDVTVRHDDEGWQHYADRWEVVAPDGDILATRSLRHPHVDEQPFTRSLSGVRIPPGVDHVTVRAHDSRHGYGGMELRVGISSRETH